MEEAMAEMMAAMKPEEEAPPKTLCSSEEGECSMGEGHEMNHEMEHGEGEEHEMNHEMGSEEDHAAMHAKHMAEGKEKPHEMGEGEGHEMNHEMEHGEGEEHEMNHEMEHGEGKEHEMNHEMEHGEGEEHEMNHEMEHGEGEEHEMNHEMEQDEDATPAMPASDQHGGGSMLDAQSLWDATMAWSIAEYMTRNPGAKVTHMVGGFHVESGTGIPEHLIQYRPGTKMLIIANQSVDDINTFDPAEHTGLGDFVVLGDASLPRTYETRER